MPLIARLSLTRDELDGLVGGKGTSCPLPVTSPKRLLHHPLPSADRTNNAFRVVPTPLWVLIREPTSVRYRQQSIFDCGSQLLVGEATIQAMIQPFDYFDINVEDPA